MLLLPYYYYLSGAILVLQYIIVAAFCFECPYSKQNKALRSHHVFVTVVILVKVMNSTAMHGQQFFVGGRSAQPLALLLQRTTSMSNHDHEAALPNSATRGKHNHDLCANKNARILAFFANEMVSRVQEVYEINARTLEFGSTIHRMLWVLLF
jgi:hypothetical protein